MGSRRIFLGLLSIALVGAAQPAAARDPDASDPPRVSGPLVGLPFECEDNGPPGPGESKGQTCSWMYNLAPAEANAAEDFSAYWIQMEIHPGKGDCALELSFDVEVEDGTRIVSASLEKGRRVSPNREPIARLLVDAEGTAPVPGVIEQDTMLSTGRERVNLTERSYSYRWTGRSPRKVVIALGLQFAYTSVPPELFTTWSEGQGMGMGSCRPMIIRVRPR